MIRGRDARTADYPIDRLFLDRWSPRAMSGEPVPHEVLMSLFEAARWAPSSGNAQPWRMLYARRDTDHWPLFFELLNEGNKIWCVQAAALVVFISSAINNRTGAPAVTYSYSTGSAWQNFALQAMLSGLVAHGMEGFDYARARESLQIPDTFRVDAMAAVGRPGKREDLPERLRAREVPSERRPLTEIVCEGPYTLS
jgi:nitroreductase